jgi:GNAT superfamily N-acetyltransferase
MALASFVIRAATLDDALAISELCVRTIRAINARDYPPDVIEQTCANFSTERVRRKMLERQVYCAESDAMLFGTVAFGGGKLHSLFVAPEVQRCGVGRELARHVEMIGIDLGLDELQVHSSITAHEFYLMLGYSTLGFEERADGSTFLMVKRLR